MARVKRNQPARSKRGRVVSVTTRGLARAVVPQAAKVFYKAAESGVNENDLVHIIMPKAIRSSTVANSIRAKLFDVVEIPTEGITVSEVYVGNIKPKRTRLGVRNAAVGHVAMVVDRSPGVSTADVLKSVRQRLSPGVRVGSVKMVQSMEDLPGEPTGPGPD